MSERVVVGAVEALEDLGLAAPVKIQAVS